MPALAAATVIAALPLLGDVHLDADAGGRGVLAWSGLRGNSFIAQTADVRNGRRVSAVRTLWKTRGSVEVGDVAVAPSGAAAICLLERPHRQREDWRIRVVLRPPNGTWSGPHQVRASDGWAEHLDCGVDDAGNVALAWTEGISDGLHAAAVSAAGVVEPPVLLARDPEEPIVEMTPSGIGLVAYATGDPETRRIHIVEKPPGAPWSRPVQTPPGDEPVQGPEFAVGGDAVRALAWNGGEDAFGIRLAQGSSLPLTPTTVSTDDGFWLAGLAAGVRGDLLVLDERFRSALRARVQRPGAPLGPPAMLGTFAEYPLQARLAGDGTGAVAWVSGSDRRPRTVARVLRADGRWGPTRQLSRTGEKTGMDIGLAPSPGGTTTVAWSTENARGSKVRLRIAAISG